MQVTAVDQENNLFRVEHAVTSSLADKVLATNWLALPWERQQGQELWARKRVVDSAIPWINEWHACLEQAWPGLEQQLGIAIQPYQGTAFWIDEPGFTCSMHTDGEMPGSLHLTWQGPSTTFYWYKDPSSVRYQVPSQPNSGYAMINQANHIGYRPLLWHAMLDPVPANSLRLTSYSWITPR